ncbi:MAG: hypothetical protein IJN83_07260, partial [Clostridia bacterium]|nr:hypothetical protein [Clostridia bacterium]
MKFMCVPRLDFSSFLLLFLFLFLFKKEREKETKRERKTGLGILFLPLFFVSPARGSGTVIRPGIPLSHRKKEAKRERKTGLGILFFCPFPAVPAICHWPGIAYFTTKSNVCLLFPLLGRNFPMQKAPRYFAGLCRVGLFFRSAAGLQQ